MTEHELVAELDRRLAAQADTRKREWWERYLKGVIAFHGVGMPDIRAIVADWLRDHDLGRLDGDSLVLLASASVDLPRAENKLAAIILLREHGLDRLVPDRHLDEIARWFDQGHIADWNTCDWLCVKVLGALVAAHGRAVARDLSTWTDAPVLWRRRAAAVAFVNLAPRGDDNFAGFTDLLVGVVGELVDDRQRFIQTATGWSLRELSKAEPDVVSSFIAAHLQQMSREAIKMATARLGDAERRRLLEAHNGNANVAGGHAGR